MLFSNLICPTLKEVPKDAEIISHQLMIRSGLIRKISSGIYSYLPLGLKILRKFENIVREEMNKAGALEILMPSLIPSKLWKESARWDQYGPELLRIKDRHNNEFCYGPTHEEVITDLVRNNIKSYKELPMNLYQIQTKFRDEVRPRFGLMRSREFVMKDAYSFHQSKECLDNTYEIMKQTYKNIFNRCGLGFKIVEADSGSIGGSCSAEFMVTSDTGEDEIIECSHCDYAANIETAACGFDKNEIEYTTDKLIEINTPNIKTIDELSSHLSIEKSNFIKTLIYFFDETPVAVLIRGDQIINEIKLKKTLDCQNLRLANDSEIIALTNSPTGFSGPVNLNKSIQIIADHSIKSISSGIAGANIKDKHFKNVSLYRDFSPDTFHDLRNAQENELCPKCNEGKYAITRGIEVGHIFQLGDKYSKAMSATFLSKEGKSCIYQMGCYGIGIGRTIAAAIEQNHDDLGIKWPKPLSPFEVVIIIPNIKEEENFQFGQKIYKMLLEDNVDVLFDDRKESVGKKFKDADLLGIHLQIVIGKKYKEEGLIELKTRSDNNRVLVSENDLLISIKKTL
jgi:prolyl-tRNA synthetase